MKLRDKSGELLIVDKYWKDDEDANSYKVKLGSGSFYSSDLISLIQEGFFQLDADE